MARGAEPTRSTVLHARDVLSDPSLAPICEMVVLAGDEPDTFEARSHDGSVMFARARSDNGFGCEVLAVDGRNPLAAGDPGAFCPLESEIANLHPAAADNHYPNAYDSVAQLFDSPNAPDIAAVHTAAHNWEDQGGHLGEHGSLDVVQARAPMILAGRGVRRLGTVADWMRNVDLAPTLAALMHIDPPLGCDGVPATALLDGDECPDHTVFFLFDGTNSNVLHAMAAAGDLPNVRRLMDSGTTLEYGSVASFPSVTLANHTTMLTGRWPGHHGILHNAYWNREDRSQVITNSPASWPLACGWLADGVETLFEALHRQMPGTFCVSVNEPIDRGADYSTFEFFRRGSVPPLPEHPARLPHAAPDLVHFHKEYAWSVTIDHMAVEQATGIWQGTYRDQTYPHPRLMWVNFTLTDSGFHIGGPHSEVAARALIESDARLGEILDAIEAAGVFDRCAFVLSADHGMEQTNPGVTGDWGTALATEGLQFRDEGFGFIYITDTTPPR